MGRLEEEVNGRWNTVGTCSGGPCTCRHKAHLCYTQSPVARPWNSGSGKEADETEAFCSPPQPQAFTAITKCHRVHLNVSRCQRTPCSPGLLEQGVPSVAQAYGQTAPCSLQHVAAIPANTQTRVKRNILSPPVALKTEGKTTRAVMFLLPSKNTPTVWLCMAMLDLILELPWIYPIQQV